MGACRRKVGRTSQNSLASLTLVSDDELVVEDLGIEVYFGVHGPAQEGHEVFSVDIEADLLAGWVNGFFLFEVVALGDQTHPDESIRAGTLSPRCSINRFSDPRVVDLLDRHVQGVLAMVNEVDDDLLEVIWSTSVSGWTKICL